MASMKQIGYMLFWVAVFVLQADYGNAKDYKYVDSIMRICPAQRTRSAESIAKYIQRKFGSETDRLRAAYSWVAQHITYDISKMHTGITYKHESEVVKQVLRTRKTVCFGYVVTLKAIAENLGIKLLIIKGYTKQNDSIDVISHAWCAVEYNNEWRLIDPTWSAGYLSSGIFHKRFNDKWFLVKPEMMIKSHIPFDPVWQFSYFPVNGREFAAGVSADSITSRFFSYPDTIKIIEQLPEKERLIAENRRIISAGDNNRMIDKHVESNRTYVEYIVHNENVNIFNQAVILYNAAVTLFNRKNLKDTKQKLNEASETLENIQNPDKDLSVSVKNLKGMIKELLSQTEKKL
jgi:transglutaminase/protease-like cytokinesis protein 3